MTSKTKNNLFFGFIIIAVSLSVYFTYERAFVTKDFEIVQTEDAEEILPNDEVGTTTVEELEVSSTTESTSSNQ